eukprot:6129593-Ditylum_brightwellii.AAC.1
MDLDQIGILIDGLVIVTREEENSHGKDKYGDMITDDRSEDALEDAIDQYLLAKLILGLGIDNKWFRRVVKHLRGPGGQAMGRAHWNLLFDTWMYEVDFTNGFTERCQANVIVKKLFAQ